MSLSDDAKKKLHILNQLRIAALEEDGERVERRNELGPHHTKLKGKCPSLNICVHPVPHLSPPFLPTARIKKREERTLNYDKAKGQLADSQTEVLESLGESLETWEQQADESEKLYGANHLMAIAARESERLLRKEYKDYETATVESRAFRKAQAQEDASAGASADGGKAKKEKEFGAGQRNKEQLICA